MKENEREEKSLAPDEDAAAKQKHRQQEDRSRFSSCLRADIWCTLPGS